MRWYMRQEEVRRKGDIGSKWGLFGNYPVDDPYVGPAVIVEAIKLRHMSSLDDSEQRLKPYIGCSVSHGKS